MRITSRTMFAVVIAILFSACAAIGMQTSRQPAELDVGPAGEDSNCVIEIAEQSSEYDTEGCTSSSRQPLRLCVG